VSPEYGLFQLLHRPDHDERAVSHPLRGAAPSPRIPPAPGGHGSGALHSGRHGRSHGAPRQDHASGDGGGASLSGGWGGLELRGQGQSRGGGPIRGGGVPAGGGRGGGGGGGRAGGRAPVGGAAPPRPARGGGWDAGRLPGARV